MYHTSASQAQVELEVVEGHDTSFVVQVLALALDHAVSPGNLEVAAETEVVDIELDPSGTIALSEGLVGDSSGKLEHSAAEAEEKALFDLDILDYRSSLHSLPPSHRERPVLGHRSECPSGSGPVEFGEGPPEELAYAYSSLVDQEVVDFAVQ